MCGPGAGFALRREGGLSFYDVLLFKRAGGVVAAFSTRRGGRSRGVYATLNLGLTVGDDRAAVLTNRELFCSALGLDWRRLVTCAQVHGTAVAVVGAADRGRGAADPAGAVPGTDGLATNTPGVPLVTFYGDCVPLFLYDPVNRAIALAHAGWRGTLGRIGAVAVAVLRERFGSAPANILAAIGPAIGPCCYTVGDEVAVRFRREFPGGLVRRGTDGTWRLDLGMVNRQVLHEAGIPPGNLAAANLCTACNPADFFSHRASGGNTGRMVAIMMLE